MFENDLAVIYRGVGWSIISANAPSRRWVRTGRFVCGRLGTVNKHWAERSAAPPGGKHRPLPAWAQDKGIGPSGDAPGGSGPAHPARNPGRLRLHAPRGSWGVQGGSGPHTRRGLGGSRGSQPRRIPRWSRGSQPRSARPPLAVLCRHPAVTAGSAAGPRPAGSSGRGAAEISGIGNSGKTRPPRTLLRPPETPTAPGWHGNTENISGFIGLEEGTAKTSTAAGSHRCEHNAGAHPSKGPFLQKSRLHSLVRHC